MQINDSKFGDTIYAFDDSSPYREFVIIDKSINHIGENPIITIIEGYNDLRQSVQQLNASSIHLHGFTIQNIAYISSWPFESYHAITISSNNNEISDFLCMGHERFNEIFVEGRKLFSRASFLGFDIDSENRFSP